MCPAPVLFRFRDSAKSFARFGLAAAARPRQPAATGREGTDMTAIRACVFDAYGTLFDVAGAARLAAAEPGAGRLADAWPGLAETWRRKQLEYTWLRAVTGRHVDFWQVTQDGLDWALEAAGLGGEAALRGRLLDLYRRLPAYPEVPAMLAALKARGLATAILSNGAPGMLADAVASAGIDPLLDAVLSVEEVGIFKPAAPVYGLVARQFDIGRQSVGVQPRHLHQLRVGLGDQLQMDIAAEVVDLSQGLSRQDQLFHRIVAVANDPRRQEQPFDIVPAIEVQRQVHHLVHAEPRPLHIRRGPVDAIGAVVDAEIGQQYLQQADAAPVRRIGVADSHALGRPYPPAADRIPLRRPRRRAGGVVLGRICKDRQLLSEIETRHMFMIRSNRRRRPAWL
jgi:2-haloacid dehalogenase